MEKELAELRERLAKVEEWKRRRQEIEDELNKVWVNTGEELAPPPYIEEDGETPSEGLSVENGTGAYSTTDEQDEGIAASR